MKSLEEYKKEIEQDPKARRRLKKLEKEFEAVEESLTDEELIKYGLKPAETQESQESQESQKSQAVQESQKAQESQEVQESQESQAVQESRKAQETQDTDSEKPSGSSEPISDSSDDPAANAVLDSIARKLIK